MSLLDLIRAEREVYKLAVTNLVQDWLEDHAIRQVGFQFDHGGEICTITHIKLTQNVYETEFELDPENDIIYLIDIPKWRHPIYSDLKVSWPQKVLRRTLGE
jgi:hypothetical protein